MITRTHTRTHVQIEFADPYLTCDQCRAWVTAWHDPSRCGCDESGWQNLGEVAHNEPPARSS